MSAIIQLNDEIFPENLIYLRKKRGLSQMSLANQAGLSVHDLRGIERGRLSSRLLYTEYKNLCSVLRISPTMMGTVLLKEKSRNKKEMTLD